MPNGCNCCLYAQVVPLQGATKSGEFKHQACTTCMHACACSATKPPHASVHSILQVKVCTNAREHLHALCTIVLTEEAASTNSVWRCLHAVEQGLQPATRMACAHEQHMHDQHSPAKAVCRACVPHGANGAAVRQMKHGQTAMRDACSWLLSIRCSMHN